MTQNLTTADIAARPADTSAASEEASDAPVRDEATDTRPETPTDDSPSSLFDAADSDRLRARWTAAQTSFVDSPQQAVQEADGLVAELMQQLAETFARERATLEEQWARGEDVTTEDLRIVLTRYRSFFERLLDAT